MSLKLISLNIKGNSHFDKIIPFLKKEKPDIICLQEVFQVDTPFLKTQLNQKLFYLPTLNVNKPVHFLKPRGNFGLAILTSLPHQSIQSKHYYGNPKKIPFFTHPNSPNRAVLWTTVTKNSIPYTVATTHFTRTHDGKPNQTQRTSLKNLLKILKTIPEFIICGDFNAPRQYSIYQTLAKHFTSQVPKSVTTTIDPYLHYANQTQAGQLSLVVDHLFTTPHYQAKNVQIKCGLSDHCAIIADIDQSTS